jgi:hypothetical protein
MNENFHQLRRSISCANYQGMTLDRNWAQTSRNVIVVEYVQRIVDEETIQTTSFKSS